MKKTKISKYLKTILLVGIFFTSINNTYISKILDYSTPPYNIVNATELSPIERINNGEGSLSDYSSLSLHDVTNDNINIINAQIILSKNNKGSNLTKDEIQKIVADCKTKIKNTLEKVTKGEAIIDDYNFLQVTTINQINYNDINNFLTNTTFNTISHLINMTQKYLDGMRKFKNPNTISVITNQSVYNNNNPENSIDGISDTKWSNTSRTYSSNPATIEYTFTQPIEMSMLYILPDAYPNNSKVTYKIYGYKDDNDIDGQNIIEAKDSDYIEMNVQHYEYNKDVEYEPIDIKDGKYKKIKIEIISPSSWCAIQDLYYYIKAEKKFPSSVKVTTNANYLNRCGENTIDNNPDTQWNSGSCSGWIQYEFENPIPINEILMLLDANPDNSKVTYTIYGWKDDNSEAENITSENGSDTSITLNIYHYLSHKDKTYPAIDIKNGTYKKIKIEAKSPHSWIAIQELSYY